MAVSNRSYTIIKTCATKSAIDEICSAVRNEYDRQSDLLSIGVGNWSDYGNEQSCQLHDILCNNIEQLELICIGVANGAHEFSREGIMTISFLLLYAYGFGTGAVFYSQICCSILIRSSSSSLAAAELVGSFLFWLAAEKTNSQLSSEWLVIMSAAATLQRVDPGQIRNIMDTVEGDGLLYVKHWSKEFLHAARVISTANGILSPLLDVG